MPGGGGGGGGGQLTYDCKFLGRARSLPEVTVAASSHARPGQVGGGHRRPR